MRELKNKVIVVTGAGSGIGRALVLHAASRGMRVVLADIDTGRLAAVLEEVRALGVEAIGVEVDVGKAPSVEELAARAYAAFGAVHVLVNNAGIAVAGAAWTLPLETWTKVLDINLYGVVHGVHSFLPRMLAGGEPGHVVNVASAAGLITVPGFAAYSASKYGVVGLSEALFHDLKVRKAAVGASVLCPSWVQTRIAHDSLVVDSDAVDNSVNAAVAKAVEHGITAESVAERVFHAIESEVFYIVTHDDTRRAVQVRNDDIQQDRAPTMAVFERKKS
ncbi:MAG TPA: SDR family NAD(P)-dependent oxidoreductase [Polyangiales bacterium]|nr:SDR family NAD(P)-dependent oxidoreductase [Polyangiales bacterium]